MTVERPDGPHRPKGFGILMFLIGLQDINNLLFFQPSSALHLVLALVSSIIYPYLVWRGFGIGRGVVILISIVAVVLPFVHHHHTPDLRHIRDAINVPLGIAVLFLLSRREMRNHFAKSKKRGSG